MDPRLQGIQGIMEFLKKRDIEKLVPQKGAVEIEVKGMDPMKDGQMPGATLDSVKEEQQEGQEHQMPDQLNGADAGVPGIEEEGYPDMIKKLMEMYGGLK